jgi:uncharacterized protein (DUF58 family)
MGVDDRDPAVSPADGVATVSMRSLVAARTEARRIGLSEPRRVLATRAGGHSSRVRGAGMDYDESRVYIPGDDPRTMDWRHTARAGRPHVKLFREEREQPLLLLVDQRSTMHFATRVAFKSVIAARAAALLGWGAVGRGERVGGLVFDERGSTLQRPVARQHGLLCLLRALAEPSARTGDGCGRIDAAVVRTRQMNPAGGVICVVSDFMDFSETDTWLSRLCQRSEVMLVAVHDPIEETAPPVGRYPVIMSSGRRLLDTSSESRRVRYEQGFLHRRRQLVASASRAGAHLLTLRTDLPVGSALVRGLGFRQAMPR